MTGGTSGVFRRLEDVAQATFLELFFDVVFIFALRALAQLMIGKLNWVGAFQTLVLLLAVGSVWSLTARVTDQLNPRHTLVQLFVIASMAGALVLSAAIPRAFGKTGLVFAITYLVIQIGRNLFVLLVVRGRDLRIVWRALVWHAAAGVLWVSGALAPPATRTAAWAIAVGVVYIARWFSYPLPRVSGLTGLELSAGGEYMAERHRQLFILGLGEVIMAIGSRLTHRGFTASQILAFAVTFAITVLAWRIYIFHAGEQIGRATAASANADVLGTLVSYAHVIMLAGLVVISVVDELVIDRPIAHPQATETITILGGPALFLAGRSLLEYLVFDRVSKSRLIGLLALACLVPPMLFLPPLGIALAAGAVLTGVVIADSRGARRQPPTVSPPGPHRRPDK